MTVWQQRGIIAAIIAGLLALILLGIFRGIERADAAPAPSPCVSYIAVARDMHDYAVLWRHADMGERTHQLWWSIYNDPSYQMWSDKSQPDSWDLEWTRRYGECLKALGG